MKQLKNMQIIGIDNGYGNLKTASGIFPASVLTFDHEPVHAQDLLVYNGKYHVIGSGHREFIPDKVNNPDHYVLTLAGIGQELWKNRMTKARVYIAAGLPLTWVESQRESFRAYLLQNGHVDFIWRGIEYHVDIVGADVYAQGFSAIVPMLRMRPKADSLSKCLHLPSVASESSAFRGREVQRRSLWPTALCWIPQEDRKCHSG